ncbi:MAG: hypothetical protein FJX74_02895, partial [Armatimonadetes bacterium]|nr:hypothetical protein [Armatimonadota bacterium]
MRPLTAVLIVSAALALSASASAQPPTYEVRTFTDSNLTPFDPAAPAATTENTLKEPWLCPLCSYSTGGTWDTSGAGAPAWDANSNGIPDEAENAGAPGDCPDPWNVHGGATVPLVQAGVAERFMAYRWLGPALTLIRGLPFRPGDVDPAVAGGATNAISRVRAAFAFDPGNAGLPGFDLGGQPTQVRFLLIPPGVARPTARYRSLQWEPRAGTPGNPIPPGADPRELWGADPEPWIRNGDIRIGVHPWRAVDGDVYQVRCRVRQGAGPSVDVQVWSDAN